MRPRRRRRDRTDRGGVRRPRAAVRLGVGDEARDRGRRARRRRGGDRRPRRARRARRARPCGTCSRTPPGLPFEGDEPLAPPGSAAHLLEHRLRRARRARRRRAPRCRSPTTSTHVWGFPLARLARPTASRRRSTQLLEVARELLEPSRLAAETLDEARTVQFPGLDGVLPGFGRLEPNDWGLGLELRDAKRAALDGRAQLAADVRPLRPQRRRSSGSTPRPALALALPHRPRLRRLGEGGLAAALRRSPSRLAR